MLEANQPTLDPNYQARPTSHSPGRSNYDVTIVGAGLGGLTAGAYLARAGLSVLVCDRNPIPGGLATTLSHEGFYLSHCPFLLWGAYPGGWVLDMFDDLGVRQEVPLLEINPLSRVFFPDQSVTVPAEAANFMEQLGEKFPGEAGGIRRLFKEIDELVDEWHSLSPDLSEFPPGSRLAMFQPLTFEQYMDRFISNNPLLRAIISSSWAHWGMPPSRISGLLAALLVGFGHRGMYTLKGGPGTLSQALADALVRAGGELMLNTPVQRIIVEQGRARGLELADGNRVEAKIVISNAPAPHTFLDLVGKDHLPAAYLRQMAGMQPSMSAFQVYLGTDLDLREIPGLAAENTYLGDHSQEEVFQQAIQGNFEASFSLFCYSLLDPQAAPPGQHCLKILGAGPYRRRWLDWERDKEGLAARMVKASEKIIPGLSNHIVSQTLRTPLDLEKVTGAPAGAIYGWSGIPGQIGPGRLGRVTPVDGLFLAGAWTGPFAGMDLCMLSGRDTAHLVVNRLK